MKTIEMDGYWLQCYINVKKNAPTKIIHVTLASWAPILIYTKFKCRIPI